MDKIKIFEELRSRARTQAWADNNPNVDEKDKGHARGRAVEALNMINLIFPELRDESRDFFYSEYFKAEKEISETI